MFLFGSQNPTKIRMNNTKSKYVPQSYFHLKLFLFLTSISAILCAIYLQDYFKTKHGNKSFASYSDDFNPYIMPETQIVYEASVIKDDTEQNLYQKQLRTYNFNKFLSDRLAADRPIPDSRDQLCRTRKYDTTSLPTVSVIISFINEANSTLMRTVHSVINRTPVNLLTEIILIDDFSNSAELKAPLDDYIKTHFSNVVLIHNSKRLGVIASRVLGSRRAQGQVLMFLDSHCEVNVGWIEPLLTRIKENRQTVVSPVLDAVDKDTMLYQPSPVFTPGFTWSLTTRWDPLKPDLERNVTAQTFPIRSPLTTGGIFAIDKNYFRTLGEFDPNFQLWGGENFEISFKTWMCGGRIEMVPCSRVGHIFRIPGAGDNSLATYLENLERVALVWMDVYKKHYFASRKEGRTLNASAVADRVELRERLGCKSFKWYLDTVYSEQNFPTDLDFEKRNNERTQRHAKRNKDKLHALSIRKGKIYHTATSFCIRYEPILELSQFSVQLQKCVYNETSVIDIWSESNKNDIRFHSTDFCLQTPTNMTVLVRCNNSIDQLLTWRKQNSTMQLFNPASGKCLQPIENKENSYLHLVYCRDDNDMNFKFINMNDARLLK